VSRTVTLILVDTAGRPLGALPPFEVTTPWWQEVGEFPPEFPVLRLLHGDRPAPPGGHVTYLAEAAGPPATLIATEVLSDHHPRRAPYAEPGGPAASVAWARESLAALGVPEVTVHQQRTWNLSAIWRFDAKGVPVAWLKQVPSFFAHEPAALALVAGVVPGLVPPLLAAGSEGRMLLAHVPGVDRYGAGAEVCAAIAEAFHPVQAHFAANPGELAGIPGGRLDAAGFARVAEPYLDTVAGLGALIDDLPRRLAEIAACGLPDTLVHGDLHPGNARTDDEGRLTIMDWGDCTVGNPAFDILRLAGHLNDPAELITAWAYRWKQTVPGSEPRRAAELCRPVAALRGAAGYAAFLAAIEPSEHPYHAADVAACLAEAAGHIVES
jgi:phosphotransferase family enzyme